MAGINLLPQEPKENTYTTKVGSTAKKAATYFILLIILIGVGVGGFYGYYYVLDNLAVRSTVNLENQIQALQPVEQKIILLRDRLTKSSKILVAPTSLDESNSFNTIINALPEGVTVVGTSLKPDEFSIVLTVGESNQITEFIRSLSSSNKYQKIEVSSLAYNPKEGYQAEIRLVNRSTQ